MPNAAREKRAEAYLDAKCLKGGTLCSVEFGSICFDYRTDEASGIRANQDHPGWPLNYPNERKLPSQLVSAIDSVSNTRVGAKRFHLFSDSVDNNSQTYLSSSTLQIPLRICSKSHQLCGCQI